MGLANAGTTCAVPAAKARNPLVAFIAVVFVAAALLFAMPSLAYASSEAEASPQASEAQEILLSQKESSTSANKTPDESPTPPGYTAQDAFNIDLGAQATEVDLVSGDGASSYTPGDDKASINDKDSDDDPDSDSNQGTHDKADSNTAADEDSDATANPKDETDSTVDSNGASSSITDEKATGSDANQSAGPTGDSKADDVIAADRDGQSADQTAGAAADKAGEVQKEQSKPQVQQPAKSQVGTQSVVTPQANTGNIYYVFGEYDAEKGASATTIEGILAARKTIGSDTDKIYWSTAYGSHAQYSLAGLANGYVVLDPMTNSGTKLPSFVRYGYQNPGLLTVARISRGAVVTTTHGYALNLSASKFPAGADVVVFCNWVARNMSVKYYQTNASGTDTSWTVNDAPNADDPWNVVLPADIAVTFNPDPNVYKVKDGNGKWYMRPEQGAAWQNYTFGVSNVQASTDGASYTGNVLHYTDAAISPDGVHTLGQLISMWYAQPDTYDASFASVTGFVMYPGWMALPSNEYKITFAIGSGDSAKGTVTGNEIKVANDGTGKVTSALWTAANVSASDTNKTDGYQLKANAWTGKIGTSSYTFNSLTELYNFAVSGDMVLSPVWEKIAGPFTVTFNANGGNVNPTSASATEFTGAIAVPVPTQEGKTFSGWYTQASGGSKITILSSSAATNTTYDALLAAIFGAANNGTNQYNENNKSVTIYAHWGDVEYKYHFESNGGSGTYSTVGSESTTTWNGTITVPAAPTPDSGYSFVGWFTEKDGAGTQVVTGSAYKTLAGNDTTKKTLTFYAFFKEDVVKMEFKVAAGSTGNVTLGHGSTTGQNTITLYVGAATGRLYTYDGANYTLATGNVGAVTPTFGSNYRYQSIGWLDGSGAELNSSSSQAQYVTVNTTTGVLTPKAYNGTYRAGTYSIKAAPKPYYYKVEYYLQGLDGSWASTPTEFTSGTANYGTAVQVRNFSADTTATQVDPKTYAGFTYTSTVIGSVGRIDAMGVGTTSNYGTNILKLYYTRNQHTVTLDWASAPAGVAAPTFTIGGTSMNSGAQVGYGQTAVTVPEPTAVPGYVFVGWTRATGSAAVTLSPIGSTKGVTFTMPDGNVVLTGTWRAMKYRVEFVNDDRTDQHSWGSLSTGNGAWSVSGSGINAKYTIDVDRGTQIKPSGMTAISAPVATPSNSNNYYFTGWEYYNASGAKQFWGAGSTNNLVIDPSNFRVTTTGLPSGIDGIITITARWGLVRVVSWTTSTPGTFAGVNKTQIKDDASGNTPTMTEAQATFDQLNGQKDTTSTNPRNAGKPMGKVGYKFTGWHWEMTGADTGTQYYTTIASENGLSIGGHRYTYMSEADLANMPVTCSITFLAQWAPTKQVVTITNTSPSGTGTWAPGYDPTVPADKQTTGSTFTLPSASQITKPGCTFQWMDNMGKTYAPGATYTVGEGKLSSGADPTVESNYVINIWPVWVEGKATINYKLGNGVATGAGVLTKANETVDLSGGNPAGSEAKANPHYTFVGWFTDAACTQQITDMNWVHDGSAGAGTHLVPGKNASTGLFDTATYYAKFIATTYEITFVADDDDHIGSERGTVATVSGKQNPAHLTYSSPLSGNVTVTAKPGFRHTGWKYSEDGGTTWKTMDTAFKNSEHNNAVWGSIMLYATYNMRDDLSIAFRDDTYTSGPIHNKSYTGMSWDDNVSVRLPSGYDVRPGYNFLGWYFNTNPNDVMDKDIKFSAAAAKYAAPDGAGVNGLTLYAKWQAKDGYQVIYNTNGGGTAPASKNNVKWDQTGLLAADQTRAGYTFLGWFVDDPSNHDNDRKITADNAYSVLAAGDDTKMSVTLTAHWKQKTYQIQYLDNVGTTQLGHAGSSSDTLAKVLYWDSVVPTFTPTKTGSTFIGWTYGTGTTVGTTTKISDLAGGVDVEDGHTFIVRASWQGNPTYTINYYLLKRNADGTYTANGAPESLTFSGYLTPGVDADATNLQGAGESAAVNYWTKFAKAGYAADTTNIHGKNVIRFNGGAIIANSGTNHVFKLYFYEKEYTLKYVDDNGSAFTPPVADKVVGWESSSLAPTTAPTRPGYGSVSWTYNGTPVAGKTIADLLGASGENTTTLTLKAVWGENKTTITYTVSGPSGSASVTPGSEQINSATGTATGSKVTLSDPTSYKLLGWFYNDGAGEVAVDSNWVVNNADGSISIVPQKEGGVYVARTYYAKVAELSALNYTVEHYFMKNDGTYGTTADETASGSDKENVTINAADKKVTRQGFTYDASAAGSITSITLLTTDPDGSRVLKLYYVRDSYTIEVIPAEPGKDSPSPAPSIDDSHLTDGKKYMGSSQNLPIVGNHDGWTLTWKLDDGTTLSATDTSFIVPFEADGKVTLTAVWTRNKMNVSFTDADKPSTPAGFSVTASPVKVDFGKNLSSVSGWNMSKVTVTQPSEWALVGWEVWNADHTVKLGDVADPMIWTIDQDTIFSAKWAQTLVVTYYPGDHAAAGQSSKTYQDYKSSDNAPMPSWASKTGGNPSADHPNAATGYAWIGWKWTLDGVDYYFYANPADALAGTTSTAMPTTVDNNYAFTALYKALDRTLSFDLSGTETWTDGDSATSKTIATKTGETIPFASMPTPQKAGWKFVGWKLPGAADSTAIKTGMNYLVPAIADDTIHFVAVFKVDAWYVTYTVEGDGGVRDNDEDTVSPTLETAPVGSTAKPNPGFKFVGWYWRDADGTEHTVDESWLTRNADGSVKITPHADSGTAGNYVWTERTYFARFTAGDTSFKIWYMQQNVDGTWGATAADIETVTTTTAGAKVTTGQTYQISDFTLKSFLGFVLSADNNGQPTDVTVLGNGSSVLKVFLERVKNDVTFEFAPGDAPSGVTVPPAMTDQVFGSTVTLPTVSAPGYKFGWTAKYTDENGAEQTLAISGGSFTMPAFPVTVTGTWTNPVYHIVFTTDQAGAGNMPNATNTTDFDRYNSDPSSTANTISWNGSGWVPMGMDGNIVIPTYDGMTFKGWYYKDAAGKYQPLTDDVTFAMLAGNNPNNETAYIYGRWDKALYLVIFEYDDGREIATDDEVEWDQTVSVATGGRPSMPGFSFAGWYYMKDGAQVAYTGGKTFEQLAAELGLTAADKADTGRGIHLIAKFTQNQTFTVKFYKGAYDESGNLVAGPLYDESDVYEIADGATIQLVLRADGDFDLVLTGNEADGSKLPKLIEMPFISGYVYDANLSRALDILSTTDGRFAGELAIYLAPRRDYSITYVIQMPDGSTKNVTTRANLAWDSTGHAGVTATAPAGYKIDGGWFWKSQSGKTGTVAAADAYSELVNKIFGKKDTSKKNITLYIKAVAQTYSVIFADDNNGADNPYTQISRKDGITWGGKVAMTPASKPGYEFAGWQIRPAGGSAVTVSDGNVFSSLATRLGLTDVTALDTPVVIYAVWNKYVGVTIEFYKDSVSDANKLPHVQKYTGDQTKKKAGETYSVAKSLIDSQRPAGYTSPAGASMKLLVDEANNIIRVVYTLNKNFKIVLDANYTGKPSDQTVSGLAWTEKPDAKITWAPSRMGYELKAKPQRWNTRADGKGTSISADMTYAQIAQLLKLDESAALKSGLKLYAQWAVANNFEVLYDLNNDRETNKKVTTAVPDSRTPIDVEELNEHKVAWNKGGFDKSNDGELDAAPNGYEFDGWNTKADGTGLKIDSSMTYEQISKYINKNAAQKSITLYAQWKELVIEITYVVDNEAAGTIDRKVDKVSAVTKQAVKDGSSAGTQLHSVATAKPGWHFVEWVLVTDDMTAKSGETFANVMKKLRDDESELQILSHANDGRLYGATYMAKFARNDNATIEYDRNDDLENNILGTGEIKDQTTAHGSHVNLSNGSEFKRGHYTLMGWNTEPDGSGTHYALGQTDIVMPVEGMKLYAEWGINNYGVTVNGPKDGGSVQPGSTSITWGEKVPKEFVDSLNPWADLGWHFTGWQYRMVDADTGEVIEGFTTDPTTLTVKGELELTPVFEGADLVDGPPRTGDDSYEFELTLAALWTALAAALAALLLMVVARRRRRAEEACEALEAEAAGVYGVHAAAWGNGRATRTLAASGYGAHSVRTDGSRVTRVELAAAAASASVEGCETREEYVERAIACGMGAHAVASSALCDDDELRSSCCGAHSVAAAGRGAHAIPVLADEAAAGAVERLGATEGAHTVSKAGESALDRLVAAYGEHSVRRADDGVWESFDNVVAPVRPAAPTARERVAAAMRGLKPRVSGAGAHEVTTAGKQLASVTGVRPLSHVQLADGVTGVRPLSHVQLADGVTGVRPLSHVQLACIYAWMCNSKREIFGTDFVAYEAPVPASKAQRKAAKQAAKNAGLRGGLFGRGNVTGVRPLSHNGETAGQSVFAVRNLPFEGDNSAHLRAYCALSQADAELAPPVAYEMNVSAVRPRSRRMKLALGMPSVFLALCLAMFGVGAHLSPSVAMADEASSTSAAGVVAAVIGDDSTASQASSAPGTGVDKAPASSGPQTANTGVAGDLGNATNNASTSGNGADAVTKAENATTNTSGSDTNTKDVQDAEKGVEGDSEGSESLEKAPEATPGEDKDAVKDAADADTNAAGDSTTNTDATAGSENTPNSSENNSDRHQNDGGNDSDSNDFDEPVLPAEGQPTAPSPADQPTDDDTSIPSSSGDDSSNASSLTTQDSLAPPGASTQSDPPPLDAGTYFIRWNEQSDFWIGEKDNQVVAYHNPGTGLPIFWNIDFMSNSSAYVIKIGDKYLGRVFSDDECSLALFDSVSDDQSEILWDIFSTDSLELGTYFISDPTRSIYVRARQTDDTELTILVRTKMAEVPTANSYVWMIGQPPAQDWSIEFFPAGATEGETPETKVSSVSGATIPECGYKRFGYNFIGWNTAEDGTGTAYMPGDFVPGDGVLSEDFVLRLFAQWKEAFVNITVSISGGGTVKDDATNKKSDSITQTVSSATGLIKDTADKGLSGVTAVPGRGFHFGSWLIDGGVGSIADSLRFNKTLTADQIMQLSKFTDPETGWTLFHDTTLVADFIANTYMIKYDANGGLGTIAARSVDYGSSAVLTKADALKRDRYKFKGWNTKADGSGIAVSDAETLERLLAAGVLADADGAITTLYAQWELIPEDTPAPTPNTTPNATPSNGDDGNNYGGYRGYRGWGYAYADEAELPAAEETDEMLDATPASDEMITTKGGNPVLDFFGTDAGKVVAVVGGAAITVAVIAGIAALVAAHGAAGAAGTAGAAGAAAAEGGFFSRLRRRIANFFGRGKQG